MSTPPSLYRLIGGTEPYISGDNIEIKSLRKILLGQLYGIESIFRFLRRHLHT